MQRVSPLCSREARFELLQRIKAHGLNTRMHAFEYLIARKRFTCMLLLEPYWNKAHMLRMKWNSDEADKVSNLVAEILVRTDPQIETDID